MVDHAAENVRKSTESRKAKGDVDQRCKGLSLHSSNLCLSLAIKKGENYEVFLSFG